MMMFCSIHLASTTFNACLGHNYIFHQQIFRIRTSWPVEPQRLFLKLFCLLYDNYEQTSCVMRCVYMKTFFPLKQSPWPKTNELEKYFNRFSPACPSVNLWFTDCEFLLISAWWFLIKLNYRRISNCTVLWSQCETRLFLTFFLSLLELWGFTHKAKQRSKLPWCGTITLSSFL